MAYKGRVPLATITRCVAGVGPRVALVAVSLAVAGRAQGADAAPVPDFARDVRPILAKHCQSCHGPDKRRANLRLDVRAAAMRGGLSGPAVVPGKPHESLLVKLIESADEDERMPQDAPALAAPEIETLRAWIAAGAPWPVELAGDDVKETVHWAYLAPQRPVPPESKGRLASSQAKPIDAFVTAGLEREGLSLSPEADRTTLLRRISLDLVGLPPTPAEVQSFVTDRRPGAYERVVDRLLASPHFGERWARPWLDLARYADSNGYEKDRPRTMWLYRDWVIRALTDDMPFDRFTIEQLAGDLLPDATVAQRIATGFHANTMLNEEAGVDPHEARYEVLVDRVSTTAAVWLGSTIGCAQCHNHKFDPFSQREFFGMLAFFDNGRTVPGEHFDGPRRTMEDPRLRVPTPAAAAALARLEADRQTLQSVLGTQTPTLDRALSAWSAAERRGLDSFRALVPARAVATGGATLAAQADQSIVVAGKNPRTASYTIIAPSPVTRLTALRLEALPDAALPAEGPGRGPNGAFMLSEIHLEIVPPEGVGRRRVRFVQAKARASGTGSPVKDAIDGDPRTGWAVGSKSGAVHAAVFEVAAPVDIPRGARLQVTLVQATRHREHTLGRFRLAVTGTPAPAAAVELPEPVQRALEKDPARWTSEEHRVVAAHHRSIAPELAATRDAIKQIDKQIKDLGIPTTLVLEELPGSSELKTFLRERGAFTSPGAIVNAGVPAVLHAFPEAAPRNRLGLARWLVDRRNPLTARVFVNRVWGEIFGRGLVETAEDFGTQGSLPTHPELLDWLAVAFMEDGWSLKRFLRTIVTSTTYRQASARPREVWARDPFNKLLGRGPRFRVDGETLRDMALFSSGLLDRKVGGPSVFPKLPQGMTIDVAYSDFSWPVSTGGDQYRRGLYIFARRSSPYPTLTTFDAGSRETCLVRRVRTNTPLQALNLLNDPVYFEAAQALAARMAREGGRSVRGRLVHGFQLVLGRRPQTAELGRLLALVRDEERGGDDQKALTLAANVILNLDEAVTKE
jgi:mono/diheme cytochrome c family protein